MRKHPAGASDASSQPPTPRPVLPPAESLEWVWRLSYGIGLIPLIFITIWRIWFLKESAVWTAKRQSLKDLGECGCGLGPGPGGCPCEGQAGGAAGGGSRSVARAHMLRPCLLLLLPPPPGRFPRLLTAPPLLPLPCCRQGRAGDREEEHPAAAPLLAPHRWHLPLVVCLGLCECRALCFLSFLLVLQCLTRRPPLSLAPAVAATCAPASQPLLAG